MKRCRTFSNQCGSTRTELGVAAKRKAKHTTCHVKLIMIYLEQQGIVPPELANITHSQSLAKEVGKFGLTVFMIFPIGA
ncbi:hypothetical protein SUGI_0774690 [Cryptomeria japonica]|nr:hypothetical protein SUGI_0774690 [Cryptomeria japonica]